MEIIDHLKEDLKVLSTYRIPPQFFGPKAKVAMKNFQDDQFDFESINYIVDFSDDDMVK